MNHFYTHHTHVQHQQQPQLTQYSSINNNNPYSPNSPITNSPPPQLQLPSLTSTNFYSTRNSNESNFNANQQIKRQQNSNSNIVSSTTASTSPWKSNSFMENFKFEPINTTSTPTTASLFSGIEDSILRAADTNIYLSNHHAMCSQLSRHHHHLNSPYDNTTVVVPNEYHHAHPHHYHHHADNSFYNALYNQNHHHSLAVAAVAAAAVVSSTTSSSNTQSIATTNSTNIQHNNDLDVDPRELEAFAEKFKQRRIKLGVTQADVGQQLSKLKLPGVGSLSQSTICRFESLTLSHNNMIALKPVLQSWLEQAELDAIKNKCKLIDDSSTSTPNINNHQSLISTTPPSLNSNSSSANSSSINSPNNHYLNSNSYLNGANHMNCLDRKRKRTSIAAPEKRSLEAYFSIQPRPSSEKIAQIADKLDLKKNVVRVWFCNQRQKQKRMKFASSSG